MLLMCWKSNNCFAPASLYILAGLLESDLILSIEDLESVFEALGSTFEDLGSAFEDSGSVFEDFGFVFEDLGPSSRI